MEIIKVLGSLFLIAQFSVVFLIHIFHGDPRDYLAQGDNNRVPTEFIVRALSEYEAPSDDALLPESLLEQ
ncbi:MAG: hypothetical protein V1754_02290 [Pseudomonadota bacterium]